MSPNARSSRRALVTGGSRGIGEAIAKRLAADGHDVIIAGRSQAALETLAKEISATAIVLDVSDRVATDRFIKDVLERFDRIDILVNNAGIARSAPTVDVSDKDWDEIMEVNATSAFRLCRGFLRGMVKAGFGRIVNIASNGGVSGYRYTAAYCASKHAMVGLTRALAMEVAPTGVTVNAVCPGWVDTDMAEAAVTRIAKKTGRGEEAAKKSLEDMSPQGRMMTAAEVAHAVSFLCADGAQGVNGQTLVIDGGAVMK
jgi:NAD(P)-dependent dehydrogenase (short-subunit alcohol dehydrogenase family)